MQKFKEFWALDEVELITIAKNSKFGFNDELSRGMKSFPNAKR